MEVSASVGAMHLVKLKGKKKWLKKRSQSLQFPEVLYRPIGKATSNSFDKKMVILIIIQMVVGTDALMKK